MEEQEKVLSDKKNVGRPSKDMASKICIRLTADQHSTLCRIGHDYKIYFKSDSTVNKSEVVQRILDKIARLKDRFFTEHESGILYDNILNQLIHTSNDYYEMAANCNDQEKRDYYLSRGDTLATIANILEDENYNDNKPDVTQKAFIFGTSEKTGYFIGVEQDRKIDKKYDAKLWEKQRKKRYCQTKGRG